MALPAWADATTVLAYAAMPEEVETSALLHGASTHQKTVGLPRMDGDRITFHVVAGPGSGSDLRRDTGQFGILEPLPDAIQWEPNPAERIFVVCPGLAFDLERNRLGRGKGYYDRFLSGLRGVNRTTVGVCFDVQLYEQVPAGPEDRRMDMVVTETRLVGPGRFVESAP